MKGTFEAKDSNYEHKRIPKENTEQPLPFPGSR